MSAGYRLFGRSGSGSLAVQVALEEIGVDYTIDWITNDPADVAKFRQVSPTGRIPALLLLDGTLMFESAAILIHLSLIYPQAQLAPPPGTAQHAKFLQWMVFLSANVYESVLRIYYSNRYSVRGEADAEAIRAQALKDYLQHMGVVSRNLQPFVLGGEYSIADIYLYMLVSWFPDGKAELFARYPALDLHAARVSSRPALVKVEADHAA